MSKKEKNRRSFSIFKFVIILVAIILIATKIHSCKKNKGDKIKWSDMELSDVVPKPPTLRGEVKENSAERLYIYINKISEEKYNKYLSNCRDSGFTIDEKISSYSFEAYNTEGYLLKLHYMKSNEELSIDVKSPMEMVTIKWPSGTAGQKIPEPKSTIGKFSFEKDDSFCVYIGNTTKDDYEEYINMCSDRGFKVDYEKGDNYYRADDEEGWHISLQYEGYNIMYVRIDAPKEDANTANSDVTEQGTQSTIGIQDVQDASEENSTEGGEGSSELDPDFKAAMDSYEEFMDEYVEFMKKYDASDPTMLSEYADFITKYSKCCEDFDKWEDTDLNAAEMAYYIEVQSRVQIKLLEIAY